MDLSIIIVNWNSAGFLRNCLKSIYRAPRGFDFEVIVIDNASFDGAHELVEQEFPRVKFIESIFNLGFACANNAAFEYSSGRNILFLNPDTEIPGSALETLVSTLDLHPTTGIAGGKLLNSDGSPQTSCVQGFPTIWNQLVDAQLLRRVFPRAKAWGMRPLWKNDGAPADVEVVSGACLMIRRCVFEQVGRFSTAYFMYAEDADLCYKVKQAGWAVTYVPNAEVVHHGGGSSAAQSQVAAVRMKQAVCDFIRLRQGSGHAALYRITMAIAASLRLLMLAAVLVFTAGRLRPGSLRTSAAKWISVLRWALGLEARAGRQVQPEPRRVIA